MSDDTLTAVQMVAKVDNGACYNAQLWGTRGQQKGVKVSQSTGTSYDGTVGKVMLEKSIQSSSRTYTVEIQHAFSRINQI
jgi:hypothetical protein